LQLAHGGPELGNRLRFEALVSLIAIAAPAMGDGLQLREKLLTPDRMREN